MDIVTKTKEVGKNKIDAHYEDGRLRIALEKEESRKAKSIAVR